jgi:hypothetical protein
MAMPVWMAMEMEVTWFRAGRCLGVAFQGAM